MNTRSLLAFNLLAWLTSGVVRPALRQCAPVYIFIQQVFAKSNISIFCNMGGWGSSGPYTGGTTATTYMQGYTC